MTKPVRGGDQIHRRRPRGQVRLEIKSGTGNKGMTVSDQVLEEWRKGTGTSTFLSVLSSCPCYSLPSGSILADSPLIRHSPYLHLPNALLLKTPRGSLSSPCFSLAASFIQSLTPSDAFVPHFSRPASRPPPHPPALPPFQSLIPS